MPGELVSNKILAPITFSVSVISLPVGFDNAGRPMGIQFIGRPGEDKALLEFALAYEATTPFLNRKPGDS